MDRVENTSRVAIGELRRNDAEKSEAEPRSRRQEAPRRAEDDAPVVVDTAPEITSPETAASLIAGLTDRILAEPEQAVAAQANLSEERVLERVAE